MRSVRFQILALVAAVLLVAVGSYFLLATELFRRDKLAYVYDLESSLTATVSEELRESLGSRVDKLGYFALAAASGDGSRAAAPLLASDPDLLSLEIWEPRQGRFEQVFRRADPARLAAVNLSEAELAEARRSTPTYDLGEYLSYLRQKGELSTDFGPGQVRMAYYPPCHLREQEIGQPYVELLKDIPGMTLEVISGAFYCCGLAGVMGFKRDFHETSVQLGSPLMQKIQTLNPETIVTDCLSCRLQFNQLLPYKVVHPIEVLKESYAIR